MEDLQVPRREFAERLRTSAKIKSDALVEAFATVPREAFLGPPPWKIWDPETSALLPDQKIPYASHDDPRMLYRDVLVALDADRGINNGQPTLWALVYDRIDARQGERIIHIGCGVGYYTAILAELVGASGSVVGLDIDRNLLSRAQAYFAERRNVQIKECNGALYAEGPTDIIIVNAGMTHPLDVWLDALNPDGRLMIPLTFDSFRAEAGFGGFFLITRKPSGFAARYICPTGILHFTGARNAEAGKRLMDAWQKDRSQLLAVSSLCRDPHDEDASCWLHGAGYCFSTRELGTIH